MEKELQNIYFFPKVRCVQKKRAQSQVSIKCNLRYQQRSQKTSLNTSLNDSNQQAIYNEILSLKDQINKIVIENNKIKAKMQYTHSQINLCQKFINTLSYPKKKKNSLHEQLQLKKDKTELQNKLQQLTELEQEINDDKKNNTNEFLLNDAMNNYLGNLKQYKKFDQEYYKELKQKNNIMKSENVAIEKTIFLQQSIENKLAEQIKQDKSRIPIIQVKLLTAQEKYNTLTFDENQQIEKFKQHLLESHQKDRRRRNIMTKEDRLNKIQDLDEKIKVNELKINKIEFLLQNQQFQNLLIKQNYLREIEKQKLMKDRIQTEIKQFDNHIFFIKKVEEFKSETDLENHFPDETSR